MKRCELEHILRASKGVTNETEFNVIGSQAILGPHPDAPRILGSLGELSPFQQTFGYRTDGAPWCGPASRLPRRATVPEI